jgi:hypothetical protein
MKKAGIRAWLAMSLIAAYSLASADVLTMPKSDEPAAAPASEQPVAPPTTPMMDQPSEAPSAAPAADQPAAAPAPQPLETQSSSETVPGRGMTMDQVEARFGDPKEKIPAVGDPPIARWNYGWYTVYFERNIVLDSVIHHKK